MSLKQRAHILWNIPKNFKHNTSNMGHKLFLVMKKSKYFRFKI